MDNTIRFEEIQLDNTVPMICESNDVQLDSGHFRQGDIVEGYELIATMTVTKNSELWYCKDINGKSCIIKLTLEHADEEVIELIMELECAHLMPILACGTLQDGLWYEVYPYYRNGSLTDKMSVETIKKYVLPGISNALNTLHDQGIMHNDIKPENLFWNDSMNRIIVGDFGNACMQGGVAKGVTVNYAAPEMLLGNACDYNSDWCSVGLTLATLMSGEKLISAESKQQALRLWQKGVSFVCDDSALRQLVNGLLVVDPRRRLGQYAVSQWCNDNTFGGEERDTFVKEEEENILTITFKNPEWIAADVDGLLKGIEEHWEYSVFLFKQAFFDKFLSQFDIKWENKCKELRKKYEDEDALFKLTVELTDGEAFIWRGCLYEELEQMEASWEEGENGTANIVAFLQKGHVEHILIKRNVSYEHIEYVKGLRNMSRTHPYEACSQLFSSLRGEEGVQWDGVLLNDLGDIVDWLELKNNDLDEAVNQIFESKKFEAWFTYQGMNGVLEDIRRKTVL